MAAVLLFKEFWLDITREFLFLPWTTVNCYFCVHSTDSAANSRTKTWSTTYQIEIHRNDWCLHSDQTSGRCKSIIFRVTFQFKEECPFYSHYLFNEYDRIWPAVLRQATYGTIKFGTYYTLKGLVTEKGWLIDNHGDERVWCNVLCAVIGKLSIYDRDYNIKSLWKMFHFIDFVILAGAISSAIATPTDVLKVRMQVHGKGTDQVGLIGCFREIYQHEGVSGLWRVWISGSHSIVQFQSNFQCKKFGNRKCFASGRNS